MKKQVGTRILSLLMTLVMVLSLLPAAAFAAAEQDELQTASAETAQTELAAETEKAEQSLESAEEQVLSAGEPAAEENTITTVQVELTAQMSGAFLFAPQKSLTVSSDLAESYGYTDDVDGGVSVLDVLVAAHELTFGDEFTKETASGFLSVSGGWISKAFGDTSGSFSFAVNGIQPNDGIYNETYHAYTGYSAAQAEVKTDDSVEFFFMQDSYWADTYVWFLSDGEQVKEINVNVGSSVSLTLKGYAIGWYGCSKQSDIEASAAAIPDAQLAWVDANGYLTDIDDAISAEDGSVMLTAPSKEGTYTLTAYDSTDDAPCIMTLLTVHVKGAPTSINVKCDWPYTDGSGKLLIKTGDVLHFTACDQDGNETPVTWQNGSTWNGTLDETTGDYTITTSMQSGSSSNIRVTAVSALDTSVKSKEISVGVTGYQFSSYQKNMSVALSEDGQTAKTVSLSGGVDGCNTWSYSIPDGVATLDSDPGTGKAIKFNCLRPGTITVSFSASFDNLEPLTDTAAITVTGVAVEDVSGNQGLTRLYLDGEESAAAAQLSAYTAANAEVAEWSSSDETVVTVDENGRITARGVGSAYIYAIDSNGTKGGIQVSVGSEKYPYFEQLELYSTAFTSGSWTQGKTFQPTKLEYDLPIKTYSTSTLTIQNATRYDASRYTAVASYTDSNGEQRNITVESGKQTLLSDLPFDKSDVTITLRDKQDGNKQTVYTFHVTRPRDTTKEIKATTGAVLVPDGRSLNAGKYNGYAEGTFLKTDENGAITKGTGIAKNQFYYRTYLQEGDNSFSLTLTTSTVYAHLRYSTDGKNWTELPQGGGTTEKMTLSEDKTVKVQIQIMDDATYAANVAAKKDGFAVGDTTNYVIWVEGVGISAAAAQLLTASCDAGDWYPAFASDMYGYNIVVPNGTTTGDLIFTAAKGATVKAGSTVLTADDDGNYTLALNTSAQSVTVTSADGSLTNTYSFKLLAKSQSAVPDAVADYLCIGSQYTNTSMFGSSPERTLAGTLVSLGNFGGYITYYFENALTDHANNKYGIDFYVYGNSSETNQSSMAELGQVYVSEDGKTWYALAGSEHYEDNAIWDYTITYTKNAAGKTVWTDNQGNSISSSALANANATSWPKQSCYYMNDVWSKDSYTFTGILFESQQGSVMGDSTTTSFAAAAKFGYVDYYAIGTVGADVNPYVEKPSQSNGFDLAWAVDADGDPVDVSNMKFHYVKVATASNIWAGYFNEKSTEVKQVVRTTAADSAVGVTAAPSGITITDGDASMFVTVEDGQQVYEVNVGNMRDLAITVNGTSEDDNIYINNQRVVSGEAADGFTVTRATGEKLVRIIVQNGDKEPVIYLLKLTGTNTTEDNTLITGINATAQMNGYTNSYQTESEDGCRYTLSVPNSVFALDLSVVGQSGADVTVQDEQGNEISGEIRLSVGENHFTLTAEKVSGDEMLSQTVTLTVTRAALSGDYITVIFSLLGDEKHGSNDNTHTLSNGNLETWIAPTTYTVPYEATVLDVFEQALTENSLTWTNSGGNYITTVNGLAAFDNGANSGWMFTLNGIYGNYGVQEQTLSDGDVIVFHYTDDWSEEDFSGVVKPVTPSTSETTINDLYITTGAYLAKTVASPAVSSIGGDWAVLGLARAGYSVSDDYYADYYENVAKLVKEKNGVLDTRKYTEYSRVILGLTAAGYDPRNVEGYNLLEPLADYDKVIWQGVNGPVFALIALDSGKYAIPTVAEGKTQTTRENLIEYILSKQLDSGAWTLSGKTGDADVTAMAIQSLAPYYNSNEAVRRAVNKALNWLSAQQDENGGYVSSRGDANSESCAQVVVALTALGIDPDTDVRFVKNGHSVLSALCAYGLNDGGFRHVADGERNGMATEQGYYALAAYHRFKDGQTALYDMTDVSLKIGKLPDSDDTQNSTELTDANRQENKNSPRTADDALYFAAGGGIAASVVMFVFLRKKKLL